jgi:hypothetical protein
MNITLSLTQQQAANLMQLLDVATKALGLQGAVPALELAQLVQQAQQPAKEPQE